MAKIEMLPESSTRNQIVLMKGHSVNFGAPVTSMIRLGGGHPVEVGSVNLCSKDQLRNAIAADTAALLYVKSHHAVQKGMVPLDAFIEVAHKHDLPVIVDAAAEEDLSSYPAIGVDLTCFSGGKAILGPASGIIVGKSALVRACRLQYRGIGRAMKVGKEAVAGLVKALETYCGNSGEERRDTMAVAEYIARELTGISGVVASVVKDESGRKIWRTEVRIDPLIAGFSAASVVDKLVRGDPAVYTRNHYLGTGVILVDPRPLADGEEKIVVERLKETLIR
jgi:L-seryl-tRNA(Ser) seleniumtransferase/D-glucosaminate-6-phosphate ammonia-lyase